MSKCSTCRYFRVSQKPYAPAHGNPARQQIIIIRQECRLPAPTTDPNGAARWPAVDSGDWCGAWEPMNDNRYQWQGVPVNDAMTDYINSLDADNRAQFMAAMHVTVEGE